MGVETLTNPARLLAGRYELETLIGKGGVGEVWRARHVALNSRVAIKFLQLASAQKESAQRRFTMEAQLTAQLKTPHAVQVFDFGVTEEGQPYLVMELLEGETLGRRLERVKRLSVQEATRLLGQAARALHRAHALGIVHRDFKPDNIVITEDDVGRDQVKVLDFGVAKLLGALEEGVAADAGAEGATGGSFTRTGAVLGTPLYMAPEQVRNPAEVDLRADIWAFGVVAFECLTGRPPFTGSSLGELFERIQLGHHPSGNFVEPSIPAAFDTWFDIACAPDPRMRFTSASVAWKHLTVALDVGLHDASGSFPGLDYSDSSGERRVFVAPGEERTDSSAPTLESERPGEVLTRSHDDEFHSLRRIPRAAISSAKSVAPPAMAPAPVAVAAPPRKRLGSWVVGAAIAAAAVGGGLVWRAVPRSSASTAPAAAVSAAVASPRAVSPAEGIAPAPAPATAAPSAAATPVVVAASAPSASPSSPRNTAHTPASARREATVAPLPAVTAEARAAAPPVATDVRNTTPPPPATPAPDPGSYR